MTEHTHLGRYENIAKIRYAQRYTGADCDLCPGLTECLAAFDASIATIAVMYERFPCGQLPAPGGKWLRQAYLRHQPSREKIADCCELCGARMAEHVFCVSCQIGVGNGHIETQVDTAGLCSYCQAIEPIQPPMEVNDGMA